MANYLISISDNEASNGVIHDVKSKLKVKAFNLVRTRFKPQKGEKQFFVTAGKQSLAFETRGYHKHRELQILQMISWYCVYLGLMEAKIHTHLPS